MKFKIVQGNIVDADVDAVVLPANSHLKEGHGASEAIFKAAGREKLTSACKKLGHREKGTAVATEGYNLTAKYIIHAIGTKWKDGEHDEYEILSSAYAYSLRLAEAMECKSIAFPLLASGYNGYDRELAFEIAVKNFEEFKSDVLKDIVLVVYTPETCAFVKSKGYEVDILPNKMVEINMEDSSDGEHHHHHHHKKPMDKIMGGLNKAYKFISDPENREKIGEVAEKVLDAAKIMADIYKTSKGKK